MRAEFADEADPRHATFRGGSTGVASKHWSISVQLARTSDRMATVRANGTEYRFRIPSDSLAIETDNSKLKRVNGGTGVWPARAENGDSSWAYKGNTPMGTVFAIPASVDVEELDLTPEGHALARALQQYGAHVLIRSGSTNLYAEIAADEEQVNNLEADWGALTGPLRVVTNNSEDSVGGSP